ncbi:MAG: glycosyltransferase family 39 protein [Pseudorhodoplanes sp.]|nr:glycosyltransferase family 39 protein [Pseudorhodoplanes sp.]
MTQRAVSASCASPAFLTCALILLALTLIRLAGLHLSAVELHFDEAQYWAWSRELGFGYFSKPPLLAWIIAASEAVCGSGEACVRASSPVIYFGTSLLVYGIAAELYDRRTAFWCALAIGFAPGMVFSARIVSTDVPLLFCWALALLAYVKLLRGPDLRWALALGVGLGFGLLAKYAMIYFVLSVGLAALIDERARQLRRRRDFWIALALGALILAPNVAWNFSNGFATFRHTADNVQGSGAHFSVLKLLEFVASQFALVGPILFGAFLIALARIGSFAFRREDRLMLVFALPVLALVTAASFVTGAHPNWAAPALIAVIVLTVALLLRQGGVAWVAASIALGAVVQVVLLASDAMAERVSVPGLAKPNVYERVLGMRELADKLARLAQEQGARAIVGDRRYDVAALTYYLRASGLPVLAWPSAPKAANYFEMVAPLTRASPLPAIVVSQCAKGGRYGQVFEKVTPLGAVTVRTGPTATMPFYAFRLDGAHAAIAPLPAC